MTREKVFKRLTSDFCKGAQDVLEYDEEDEEECDHKWPQDCRDGFSQNETCLAKRGGGLEMMSRLGHDGQDELLS